MLIHFAPFVAESFINTPFATSQLINKTGISLSQSLLILEVINGVLVCGLIVLFFSLFFKRKIYKNPDTFSWFLMAGFFISAATYVSLGYLTATYKPQNGFGYGWNYLGESRYYMFVNLFLQLAFFGWIFLYSSWKKNVFQKSIIVIFSLLLFIEVTHNIYFHTKVVVNPEKYSVAPNEEPDYVYFLNLVDTVKLENPEADLWVIADGDDFFPLMTNYLGYKGFYDGFNMIRALPSVKKQTILIIALYDNEIEGYRKFFSDKKAQLLNRINNVTFFRVNLSP